MMTDDELMQKIDNISGEFQGQLDDLYKVVGMIVIGRFYGWRVMRLVSTRSLWKLASKHFGDPKLLMLPRGKYAHKSLGLLLSDKLDNYWEVVKGHYTLPGRKLVGENLPTN